MKHGQKRELAPSVVAAILLIGWSTASGQQPAKQINPTPLSRPEALLSMPSTDPVQALESVRRAIAATGYKIERLDAPAGTLEAKREDGGTSKHYDKILVWLERDLRQPTEYMKLYFLYGRYEEILAARRDVYRVVVDPTFEAQHTASVRTALLALATTPGDPR